jgi:hypothetical protein
MKSYKTIGIATVASLILIALCIGYFGYKTGKNKRIIYSHRSEYHQVIHPLFDNRIVENQFVGEVTKKYPPTKISTHDNFLTLQYFNDNEEVEDCCIYYSYYIHIIVKDNKFVKAFAAEGLFSEIDYVFFDVLNESSEDEYWESRMNNAVAISNL